MKFIIWDSKKKTEYVPRQWAKRREAEYELYMLLIPYGPDDPWRKRLIVKEVGAS